MVDDGYLTENTQVRDRLLAQGSMTPITRPDLLAMLEYYCDPALDALPLDHSQTVIGINTLQGMRARGLDEPEWLRQPIFSHLHRLHDGAVGLENAGAGGGIDRDFRAEFLNAESLHQAAMVVSEALIIKLSRTLSSLAADGMGIDVHKPIVSYGLDSLIAVVI